MTVKQQMQLGVVGIVVLTILCVLVILPGGKIPYLNRVINPHFKLGLDLLGGTQLVYQADVSQVPSANRGEALQGVRDVIERRVNAFGISEPRVQTTGGVGEARVVVELAGIKNPDDAIKLIGETPQLDFREEEIAEPEDKNKESTISWKRTELTGKNLKRADVSFDQNGAPDVSLTFDKQGTELFSKLTGKNIGKRIGIFLDGYPITAPTVQTQITQGQAVITGNFTIDEAKQLATRLNAGALPVPINLISRTSVGPTLGHDSLGRSVVAGVMGLIIMILYMVILYRYPGAIAAFALVLYALINLAVYKILGVTMTLAGVAGFILSIGMAVDANVLIFERLKEELRNKKALIPSVVAAFKEAWDSIRDSNVSSLITCALLYMLGSSIVKGFALTLAIGIIISMFSAITVTRTLLRASSQSIFLSNKKLYASDLSEEAKEK